MVHGTGVTPAAGSRACFKAMTVIRSQLTGSAPHMMLHPDM
ncbi:MAG: hypothetical protein ABW096_03965 [Candidatus Thiodiazotropha sp.]